MDALFYLIGSLLWAVYVLHESRQMRRDIAVGLHSLSRIESKVDRIMADVTSIKQLVSDINDETNTVAAKVDAQAAAIATLQAQVAAGGTVSAADLQAIQDGLQPISDRLKSIGANPAAPIPPAV